MWNATRFKHQSTVIQGTSVLDGWPKHFAWQGDDQIVLEGFHKHPACVSVLMVSDNTLQDERCISHWANPPGLRSEANAEVP